MFSKLVILHEEKATAPRSVCRYERTNAMALICQVTDS